MKLALERISSNSICILDGDYNAQVDLATYAGSNNGMRRVSKVYRDRPFYAEVTLINNYRSDISNIADLM
jgi:predicted ribonuclease YlaK